MIPSDIKSRQILESHIQDYIKFTDVINSAREGMKRVEKNVKSDLGKDVAETFKLLVKARLEEDATVRKAELDLVRAEEALEQSRILQEAVEDE